MRLADYLDTAASRYPDKEAMVFGAERISFATAQRTVHAIATRLRRIDGLPPNAHVCILSPNDWRVPMVQLGVNRADMVWLGLHDRSSPAVNAKVCVGMDGRIVFFHSAHAQEIPELRALLPGVMAWVCLDANSDHGPSLERWLDGHWETVPYRPVDKGSPACIMPTGGTTGPSKGAVQSHHSLEMQCISLAVNYDLGEDARLLTIAPLSHAAGHLAFGLLPNAGTNVILSGFDAATLVDIIPREGITHFFLPPTVLYMLMAHPAAKLGDYSTLQGIWIGAAPVAPEKFREAISIFGPVLFEGYAQSETLIPVLVKRPTDYMSEEGDIREAILASAGRATDYMRVEIVDADGTPLERGARGEIAVRASQGMTGYYKQPEATQEVRRNGFHLTGDIGVMDEEGFITIVDRKKDMIVTGGFNVFPAEVEAVINSHEAVLDCIVIGVPDEKWGEAIRALVQLKAGHVAAETELLSFCRERLGGVKTPKAVELCQQLPRSAVGKLLRREARAKYWEGHWRSV